MNRDCPWKAEISESRQFLQRTKEPPRCTGQLSRMAPDAEAQSYGAGGMCSKTQGAKAKSTWQDFLV